MTKELQLLLEKVEMRRRSEKKFDLIARVFTAPIILWKGGWTDTVPKWLLDYIKLDRLIALMKDEWDGMATDAEALAYIMPRALEAPLGHDWTNIYLYLGTKVMRQAKRTKIPEDVAVEKLEPYQQQKLDRLKTWIWKKQDEALHLKRKKKTK